MAGTPEGGRKTVAKVKALYGEDFYKKVGHKGGTAPRTAPRMFAADRELASKAGKVGGILSRRSKYSRPTEINQTVLQQASEQMVEYMAERLDKKYNERVA